MTGKANDSFNTYVGPEVQQLMKHFGLSGSVSQRAEPMLRAIDADGRFGRTKLRNPELLVSRKRADLILVRDHYRALLSD